MFNKGKKYVRSFIVVTIILALTVSLSLAQSTLVNLKANTGMKIYYNGNELKDDNPVYLIDNTTYIPLRMLMNYFGDKEVKWDSSAPDEVIVNDKTNVKVSELTEELNYKNQQIETLKTQITELQNQIISLNTKSAATDDLDDIESKISDSFDGDDYFGDDIGISVSLSGNKSSIAYTISLDFDDSDDYEDLSDFNTSSLMTKLRTLMTDVKSKLEDEIDNTDFESAVITGKLVDADNSEYYVQYKSNSYTYYLEDEDDLDEIAEAVNDAFEDEGDEYFDDDIAISIELDGDEDDIEYEITLDFSDADDYDDLSEFDTTSLKNDLEDLMEDVLAEIEDQIEDTNFEDADITGELLDADEDYNVEYNGTKYTYNLD